MSSNVLSLLKSFEDVVLQEEEEEDKQHSEEQEDEEQEEVQDDVKEETKEEPKDDCETFDEKPEEEAELREDEEHTEYGSVSLGFRDSDGEKSLDLPESPRPLSQETRNLTASELLLNKSVSKRNGSVD